eukprot:91471_1
MAAPLPNPSPRKIFVDQWKYPRSHYTRIPQRNHTRIPQRNNNNENLQSHLRSQKQAKRNHTRIPQRNNNNENLQSHLRSQKQAKRNHTRIPQRNRPQQDVRIYQQNHTRIPQRQRQRYQGYERKQNDDDDDDSWGPPFENANLVIEEELADFDHYIQSTFLQQMRDNVMNTINHIQRRNPYQNVMADPRTIEDELLETQLLIKLKKAQTILCIQTMHNQLDLVRSLRHYQKAMKTHYPNHEDKRNQGDPNHIHLLEPQQAFDEDKRNREDPNHIHLLEPQQAFDEDKRNREDPNHIHLLEPQQAFDEDKRNREDPNHIHLEEPQYVPLNGNDKVTSHQTPGELNVKEKATSHQTPGVADIAKVNQPNTSDKPWDKPTKYTW